MLILKPFLATYGNDLMEILRLSQIFFFNGSVCVDWIAFSFCYEFIVGSVRNSLFSIHACVLCMNRKFVGVKRFLRGNTNEGEPGWWWWWWWW